MPKAVVIISALRITEFTTAAAVRIHYIAKAIKAEGIEVFLWPVDRVLSMKAPSTVIFGEEIYQLIPPKVTLPEKWRYRLYRRLAPIYSFLFTIRLVRYLRTKELKTVIYHYPSGDISLDLMLLIFRRLKLLPAIFADINELRNADNEVMVGGNLVQKTFAIKYKNLFISLKYMISDALPRFYDGLIVISTALKEYFHYYNHEILLIPILADVHEFPLVHNSKEESKPFQICYSGTLSIAREGFECFLHAISLIRKFRPLVELHCYGTIPEFEKDLILEILPKKYGLEHSFIHHGFFQNHDEVLQLMKSYHLLVMLRSGSKQNTYSFPTKLSEYMVSGVPVLANDVGDISLYLKDGINAFVVPPDEPVLMADKIRFIIDNYCGMNEIVTKNAFQTAKVHFSYQLYGEKIADFFFKN